MRIKLICVKHLVCVKHSPEGVAHFSKCFVSVMLLFLLLQLLGIFPALDFKYHKVCKFVNEICKFEADFYSEFDLYLC